jgi:hypothetical protein
MGSVDRIMQGGECLSLNNVMSGGEAVDKTRGWLQGMAPMAAEWTIGEGVLDQCRSQVHCAVLATAIHLHSSPTNADADADNAGDNSVKADLTAGYWTQQPEELLST